MTRKIKLPKCPQCRDRGKVQAIPGNLFRCNNCRGTFDDDPDEGGDYHADPARRLIQQERDAKRGTRRQLKGGFG